MSEVPDTFDPSNEAPQTLRGMIEEQLALGRDLLARTDQVLLLVRIGKPDPLVGMLVKMAEMLQLQQMVNAAFKEELDKLWAKSE